MSLIEVEAKLLLYQQSTASENRKRKMSLAAVDTCPVIPVPQARTRGNVKPVGAMNKRCIVDCDLDALDLWMLYNILHSSSPNELHNKRW
jgi:hypothetical protein